MNMLAIIAEIDIAKTCSKIYVPCHIISFGFTPYVWLDKPHHY